MKVTNPKDLKKILADKKTRTKLLEIIHLRQEERIMHKNMEKLQHKHRGLENEITLKYKLGFMDIFHLISVLEGDKEMLIWLKKGRIK